MTTEHRPAQSGKQEPDNGDTPGQTRVGMGDLMLSLILYTAARLGLVVVVAALIMGGGALAGVTVPVLVAAIFGVLIAMPVGMLAFKKLRLRVNGQIAVIDAARKARHEDLESRLRGSSLGR
ncbi:MAG: DUF4229 domain-containing protein [Gordonia sp. (in: high G+C Gram-positive bacteria)]